MNQTKNITNKAANKARYACFLAAFGVFAAFGFNAKASEINSDTVIKLVNDARKEANVDPLKTNSLLQKAAEKKAQDMVDHDYFAHTSPQGLTPWDFITKAGYDYRFAGENLAINFTDAKDQQQAWMDSPLHRKNILNSDFQEIGVAVKSGFIDGHQTIVTVQEFGSQMPKVVTQNVAGVEAENKVVSQNVSPIAPNKMIPTASTTVLVENKMVNKTAATGNSDILNDVFKQLKSGDVFQNSRLTLAGWVILFIFSIFATLLDMFFIAEKKHKDYSFASGYQKKVW